MDHRKLRTREPADAPPDLGALNLEGAWGKAAKEYLARARASLAVQQAAGARGAAVVKVHTKVVDYVVRTLFNAAHAEYASRFAILDERCTMVAQGGYGRGELNPCSDIDLLFLYVHRPGRYVETVTERVLYALYDTGLDIGHALRTVAECVRLAGEDLTVKTALLTTRLIGGDTELYDQLTQAVERQVLQRRASRFFQEKLADNAQRHLRYGDSIYLVEPHLKEGEGGLRDLHTAMWMAKVKFKTHDVEELVQKGVITERELAEIEAARDFLWRVRNSLHLMSGEHQDHLTFEYQERIASEFGYRNGQIKGVEQFMRDFYIQAATVNRFSDAIIALCVEPPEPYRFMRLARGREIGAGMSIVRGELVIADAEVFANDPGMLVRVFSESQRHQVRLGSGTRRLIRAHLSFLGSSEREAPGVADAFLAVLRAKSGVYEALREMHKLGVLGAVLPEFGRLYCLAQYDQYHLYTVDEHSLRGVLALERLRQGEQEETLPLLTELMRQDDRAEILYLAILLHDIGKGLGGNHSQRGAAIVREIARRLRLNSDDAQELECLVRDHLVMHHLATRRDISDEKLVIDFAASVGTLESLQRLYLLTFADMCAVNPKAWNEWHETLLNDLYLSTVDVFERGVFVERDQAQRADRIRARVAEAVGPAGGKSLEGFLIDLPDRYFLSTPEADIPRHFELGRLFEGGPLTTSVTHFRERSFSEFTVLARDRPGIFSKITGVLTAHGMNILGARITTSRCGNVIDVFRLSHLERPSVARSDDRWERIREDVPKALEGELDVERLVSIAARPSVLSRKVFPRVSTRIEVDNRASTDFTVLDVYARDRVGVLFAITNALFHLGISVHLAKITTNVDHVLDVFYVTETGGSKIEDSGRLEEIRNTLLEALGAVTEAGGPGASAPAGAG